MKYHRLNAKTTPSLTKGSQVRQHEGFGGGEEAEEEAESIDLNMYMDLLKF